MIGKKLRFVESTLAKNETVVLVAYQSRWEYIAFLGVFAIVFLILLSLGNLLLIKILSVILVVGLIRTWIKRWTTEQAMTSRGRIIVKSGLIARDTTQMSISDVESINVQQSILGRILGYATIIFTGRGEQIMSWRFVRSANSVAQEINQWVGK